MSGVTTSSGVDPSYTGGDYVTTGPTMSFSGGGGSGASGTPLCAVNYVEITDGGSGYTNGTGLAGAVISGSGPGVVAPTVTFNVAGGVVTTVTVTYSGRRMTSASITFPAPPPPSDAKYPAVGFISSPVGFAGSPDGTYTSIFNWYLNGSPVTLVDPPVIEYTISGGVITVATITYGGCEFNSTDTWGVNLYHETGMDIHVMSVGTTPCSSGTPGTQATGLVHLMVYGEASTPNLNVLWSSHGSGYTSAPAVTFSAGAVTAIGGTTINQIACLTWPGSIVGGTTYTLSVSPPGGTNWTSNSGPYAGSALYCTDLGSVDELTPLLAADGYTCLAECCSGVGPTPWLDNGGVTDTGGSIVTPLTMSVSHPSLDFGIFQNCSLAWTVVPSTYAGLPLGYAAYISTASFTDTLSTDPFQYCLLCSVGVYALTRIYPDYSGGGPYKDITRYQWTPGFTGNTCSPFSMANGTGYSGHDVTNVVTLSG